MSGMIYEHLMETIAGLDEDSLDEVISAVQDAFDVTLTVTEPATPEPPLPPGHVLVEQRQRAVCEEHFALPLTDELREAIEEGEITAEALEEVILEHGIERSSHTDTVSEDRDLSFRVTIDGKDYDIDAL